MICFWTVFVIIICTFHNILTVDRRILLHVNVIVTYLITKLFLEIFHWLFTVITTKGHINFVPKINQIWLICSQTGVKFNIPRGAGVLLGEQKHRRWVRFPPDSHQWLKKKHFLPMSYNCVIKHLVLVE